MRKNSIRKSSRNIFSLFHVLYLGSSFKAARAALPLVDFDRMGAVGLAGSFLGFDFFNSTPVTFDPSTSTLLLRGADGSLTKVGSTNTGGSIVTGCAMSGQFYFGGSFTSIENITASNVAVYDPSKTTFTVLGGGGLDGNTTSTFCDSSRGEVWFGGSFLGPTTGTNGYGGSVAVYTAKSDSWSPPPFSGLDGPVFSITPSLDDSSLFLAGSFHTSFTSSNGTTNTSSVNNPNVPFSSGATPFSSSLVPIPLSAADIDASPSTSQAQFSNITNVLCPAGADGPGNTWLSQDGFEPFITVQTSKFLTSSGIRLGNTFVQGRSTTNFTVTTLPDNVVLTLNFTDPSTGDIQTCSNNCPLLQNQNIPYQDFLIMGPAQSFSGIQIALTEWIGAGPGLHILQILSDGAFASAVQSQNGISCFAPDASSTAQTGTWNPKTIDTSIPGTQLQVLVSDVASGTAVAEGPTFTWEPYVSASGTYNMNLLVPGCTNLQDCDARTTVKVTVFPGGGLQPSVTTVNQQVDLDTAFPVYNGPIFPTSPNFTTTITMALAETPTGNGQNGNFDLVADRVQLQLLSANTSAGSGGSNSNATGTSNGSQSGFGFFEWPLSDTSSVNATTVLPNNTETSTDNIAFQLSSAIGGSTSFSIRSVAVHSSGAIFLGGDFTLSSRPSNVVAFKNNTLVSLEDNGLNGGVSSLAIDGNMLFVGGEFRDTPSNTGQGSFRGVVGYDIQNDKWIALQAGVNGAVQSLNIVDGQLLLAGNFTTLLASPNSTSGAISAGLAAWNIANSTWAQSGGYISGQMSFIGNGTGASSGFVAGNVDTSVKFGSDGFAMLQDGNAQGPTVTALKVQLDGVSSSASSSSTSSLLARWKSLFSRQSQTQSLPAPPSALAPAVLAGAFWTNSSSSKQVTVLGGNFTVTTGSIVAQNLVFYEADTGALVPVNGEQINGTIYTLLVQGNQLFVGGQFTLQGSAQGGNGFAIYDLDKQQWDVASVDPLQGTSVVVRSITSTSFKNNVVYVAGTFSGAGSLTSCVGICSLDTGSNQWSSLANGIEGEVASVDYASSDLELLIAGGSITLGGDSSNVAMFSISNSTWSAIGGGTKIPGPVTAIAVNDGNSSSIFAGGQSMDGSGPFLNFWDGITWSTLSNSSLGQSSSVQQLMMVPLQDDHPANAIIQSDRMLMISGSLESASFGNASSALFDGQTFIPYIVTVSPSGTLGSVASLFHSLATISFSQRHLLATGVVILISIAISAGIVFFLVLIGVLWTFCLRRGDQDTGAFLTTGDDDDSLRGPSSLLEHINAATRTTILGAGASSPFDFSGAHKEAEAHSPGMGADPDPFAADTQDGHGTFVTSDESAPVGTAIRGEDEVLRKTHARYSFEGGGEGELALSQGIQVDVLDSNDTAWWYVRDANGREGVVPASYLY